MVPVAYRLQLNPRVCAVLAAWLFIYLDFLPVWMLSGHMHVWPYVLYFFILWCPAPRTMGPNLLVSNNPITGVS